MITAKERSRLNLFLNLCLDYAASFIEVGGSTSRLERKISELGSVYNLDVQIFSTPSAVILSLQDTDGESITSMRRVQEDQINLSKLKDLNTLINQAIEKEISAKEAKRLLDEINDSKPIYPISVLYLSAFLVGFFSSFSKFGNFKYASFAGAFSLFITGVISPFFHKFNFTRIYIIFFSLTLTTIGIGLLSHFYNFPIEQVLIGAVILLLPGFRITNAVSELAEHNFTSGTVKMAKAIIILIALGASSVIAQEILELMLGSELSMNISEGAKLPFIKQLISIFILITCFSITCYIPVRSIAIAAFAGISGWSAFYFLSLSSGVYISSFIASFIIGFISLSFSRFFKVPSQIYSVPGIISLVPGLFAFILLYRSSSKFAESNSSTPALVSLLVASLVFGLISARVPFQIHQNSEPVDD